MQMEDVTNKSKRKGFLAPLKSKDDSQQKVLSDKQKTSKCFEEKTAVSINSHKKGKKRKEGQDNIEPHTTLPSKTDQDGQAPQKSSKKAKSTDPTASTVPKSLTDNEYNELFRAVLQGMKSADDDEEAINDKETEPAVDVSEDDKKQASQQEKLERKEDSYCKEKDDADSVKSEDVDTWTDSPAHHDNQSKDHQQLLKGKPFAKKKADRSGILKPRKLILSPSLTSPDLKKKKQAEGNDSNGTPQIKKKYKQKCEQDVQSCGLNQFEKKLEQKQRKGLSDHKMNKKKKKEAKDLKRTDLQTIHNQQEVFGDQEEETGTWIQCSNNTCGKWRYVEGIEDPILVPADWECKMNPDTNHNSCDLPEVDYDESEHICTTFTVGSIVWAKMDGYPWWPGMIEPDPDYDTYFELLTEKSMVPFQYHVTFFDDHVSRAWIRLSFIAPYIKGHEQPENKISKGRNSYKKEIQQAIANADKAITLSLLDRVSTYGFLRRYNKKSKWRVKDNLINKAKKAIKERRRGINKPSENQPESQPACDQDTDDSSEDLNDFSDLLEDSEYNPVKTKSRGLKSSAATDSTVQRTEPQNSKNESIRNDDESSEDDGEDENNSQDRCKSSQKTRFDPEIFTMEADTPHVEQDTRCDTVKGADLSQSPTDFNRQKIGSGKTKKSLGSSHDKGLFGTDTSNTSDTEKEKSNRKKETCKTDDAANVNCEENMQRKKKKAGKLSLTSKVSAVPTIEKSSGSDVDDVAGNELKVDGGNVTEDSMTARSEGIHISCKNITKKDKRKKQEKSRENNETLCASEDDGKKKQKEIEKKVKNSNSRDNRGEKGSETFEKDKVANKSNKAGLLHTEHHTSTKNSKETNNDIHATSGTEKQKFGEKYSLVNRQEIKKSKTKKAKEIECEDESDKENIEPKEGANQNKKTKQNSAQKGVKRHANANKSSSQEQENIGKSKAKKVKISATTDKCFDSYAKAVSNTSNDKEEEQEKLVQNPVKVNKKKTKSFAAPLKAFISSDREVPQISSSSDRSNKNEASAKKDSADSSVKTDQHIVPDMTESNIGSDLDIDTEQVTFDGGKAASNICKHIESKVSKVLDNANASDDNDDEDKLDLDITAQKADLDLPQKFLSDSEESDSGEMAELNLEGVSNGDKVKVEEIKDMPQIFGRFAGRCTEHGSDSDPMELIED